MFRRKISEHFRRFSSLLRVELPWWSRRQTLHRPRAAAWHSSRNWGSALWLHPGTCLQPHSTGKLPVPSRTGRRCATMDRSELVSSWIAVNFSLNSFKWLPNFYKRNSCENRIQEDIWWENGKKSTCCNQPNSYIIKNAFLGIASSQFHKSLFANCEIIRFWKTILFTNFKLIIENSHRTH